MKHQEYWDHNKMVTETLFQNFFNASMSVGKASIYIRDFEEQLAEEKIEMQDVSYKSRKPGKV